MGIIGDNERWRQVGDQTQNYWRVPGETRQLLYLSLLGDTLRLAQLAQPFPFTNFSLLFIQLRQWSLYHFLSSNPGILKCLWLYSDT